MTMLTFAPQMPNINIGKKHILRVRAKCVLLWGIFRTMSTYKMERFGKIIEGFEPSTIFAERSILDIWQGSEYASAAGSYFSLAKKLIQ